MMTAEEQKLEYLKALEAKLDLQQNLPHLYGWKWYKWARAFFDSTNRYNFLVASNQCSKSSTQIRKCIHWATEPEMWKIWPTRPSQFWYFYPSYSVITSEIEEKWIKEFLPRGKYKDDPKYGWEYVKKATLGLHAIKFKSGVTVYFKSYEQSTTNLQTSSVHALFCFPKGTKVVTANGIKSIEAIDAEDTVLSEAGWRRVVRVYKQEAEVLTKRLSLVRFVNATGNHPYFTYNRGWVDFADLQPGDVCAVLPLWSLIEKWCSLTARFTSAIQSMKTSVVGSILRAVAITPFMWLFGKSKTKDRSKKVSSSTTRTSTLWTTAFLIWRCLHEQNTREFTKKRNGEVRKPTPLSASSVEAILFPDHLRTMSHGIVPRFVEKFLNTSTSAWLVRRLSWASRRRLSASVLRVVQTKTSTVYNLAVEDSHTYFAGGLLVHNCDEELPAELFSELNARISSASIQGHFHMVFTATLGQSFWRETMEEKGDAERFKNAFKLNVTLYDCLEYDDGSKSLWTKKIINDIKASCKSEAEIQRRVYGRFVVDDDLKYQEFVRARHLVKGHPLPKSWLIFVGVDLGSGGTRNHPAAITFIGVRPDFKEARVFLGWRGDNISTTAGDVLQQFQRMKARMKPVAQYYDWAAKDFHTMASRVGEPFQAAEKGHELGEQVLNVLFKNDMLKIYDTPELQKLANEFEVVRRSQDKTKAKDDFIDSLRYAVTKIPWDFTDLSRSPGHIKKLDAMTERERFYKGKSDEGDTDGLDLMESEFDEANEAYEYYRDEAFG